MENEQATLNERTIKVIRCHDITVSLNDMQSSDLDKVVLIGMSVRLALHLRGMPLVDYQLLKQVAFHLLHIPAVALPHIIDVLAEVEFIRTVGPSRNITAVIPMIPYYNDMFTELGEFAETEAFSECEQLTLNLLSKLAASPTPLDSVYNLGAERRLVESVVQVGNQGGFIVEKRTRGRDMLVTPLYFSENMSEFADLAAKNGSKRVSKVVNLLAKNQGWPLGLIKSTGRIGDTTLTPEEINIIISLSGDGFASPPMIKTKHAGENHFLFAPKIGVARIGPNKRQIYEAAMALVAAIRQGQLLPARYKIRDPLAILNALQSRGHLSANSEALEQYKQLAILKMGRLERETGTRFKFTLIDTPENREAVDLAIQIIRGDEPMPTIEEEAVLAFREGHSYLDSLVGRQRLVKQEKAQLDPETQEELDNFLLGV